ncbi:hypothetical protein MPH_03231 [Macrophomina phaseolina MS6]|uniref:Uncharacterized protein n=1 Tax=Macrophomina phaseolina (strain MS6) TaxID=1126212 RepID=K2RX73_MACPH|nr:hypothetical protein MPH_03231 [Macrophomina phaseolina MS6]
MQQCAAPASTKQGPAYSSGEHRGLGQSGEEWRLGKHKLTPNTATPPAGGVIAPEHAFRPSCFSRAPHASLRPPWFAMRCSTAPSRVQKQGRSLDTAAQHSNCIPVTASAYDTWPTSWNFPRIPMTGKWRENNSPARQSPLWPLPTDAHSATAPCDLRL